MEKAAFSVIKKNMNSYHGTSSANASSIASGTINVKIGGGELGRGFYTGEHLHEAKAWAFHISGDKQSNVVSFTIADDDVEELDLKLLDDRDAGLQRYWIRKRKETRSFLFDHDMVWAPIVGSERASGDHYKWESSVAQSLLNSPHKTQKGVI